MMKNMMVGTYFKGEESFDFNFYTELLASDKLKFVDSVVGLLVNDEHYNSIIRDLIFDFYVIDIFTNVDISELKFSDSFLNDVEKFLDETNIVDIVKANASDEIFDELNKAVDKSIQYLTGIYHNPFNDAIASLISTLEKKVNEIDLDSAMKMAQKFVNMTTELTPESIVDAYMESGEHMSNLEEIERVKKEK